MGRVWKSVPLANLRHAGMSRRFLTLDTSGSWTQLVMYGTDLKLRARRVFQGFTALLFFSTGGAHCNVVKDKFGVHSEELIEVPFLKMYFRV